MEKWRLKALWSHDRFLPPGCHLDSRSQDDVEEQPEHAEYPGGHLAEVGHRPVSNLPTTPTRMKTRIEMQEGAKET
jgi:hypothetical protein